MFCTLRGICLWMTCLRQMKPIVDSASWQVRDSLNTSGILYINDRLEYRIGRMLWRWNEFMSLVRCIHEAH